MSFLSRRTNKKIADLEARVDELTDELDLALMLPGLVLKENYGKLNSKLVDGKTREQRFQGFAMDRWDGLMENWQNDEYVKQFAEDAKNAVS